MVTTRIRQAVVLAGGRGTRLGALTHDAPKPMLPVGGRPFIDWVIDHLGRQGVADVILTVGYRADVFAGWAAARDAGPDVELFVEERPLDTGGALCELGERLADTFYVLNGDTLFDVPLERLEASLLDPDSRSVRVALALRRVDDVGRYGAVSVDGGLVTTFAEKSGAGGPGWINGGVYAMRREALEDRRSPLSIERTLIPELVAERRVTALPCDGFFIDIGVPETYAEAQRSVPEWWRGVTG